MSDPPALHASDWLNSDRPLALEDFRGRVLAVEAFQMLCPGCVLHGLPQAQRIAQTFDPAEVAVIGLHSVFEHHAANSREALAAFLHEWRIRFPVAIDAPGTGRLPRTMEAWQLQGTPTLVLIDRQGRMRARHFGQVPDLALGAQIMALLREAPAQPGG
ncbi:MAG: TlpA family protein disulfide reductase [Rhodobacteraceae bacterium]|nr:TlpA family protein disulfide reductase [Paracoccaceae bacterium]